MSNVGLILIQVARQQGAVELYNASRIKKGLSSRPETQQRERHSQVPVLASGRSQWRYVRVGTYTAGVGDTHKSYSAYEQRAGLSSSSLLQRS